VCSEERRVRRRDVFGEEMCSEERYVRRRDVFGGEVCSEERCVRRRGVFGEMRWMFEGQKDMFEEGSLPLPNHVADNITHRIGFGVIHPWNRQHSSQK